MLALDALIAGVATRVIHRMDSILQQIENGKVPVLPRLLSVSDAAVYLGRSSASVRQMIFYGELPVIRHGRRVHLDKKDLDAFIEQHRQRANPKQKKEK